MDDLTMNQSLESNGMAGTYEKEIEGLKIQLMRMNNDLPILNSKNTKFDSSYSQWRLSNKLLNEDNKCENLFQILKQEFLRISSLVSEANTISNELQQQIVYNTILQIPVSYLKPNERSIDNLCEVAIQVKQGISTPQIWDVEKFEFKFNNMREIFNQWKMAENKNDLLMKALKGFNPFIDEESNSFIGVANIYLKALFYVPKLDYIVPIINTQGETSGSLHVVLEQTGPSSMKRLSDLQINSTRCGSMSEGISADIDEQSLDNRSNSQHSFEDEGIDDLTNGKNDQITIKFTIKQARDLPQSDAESAICLYTFINPKLDQTVYSTKPSVENPEQKSNTFPFDHETEYTFKMNDNFISTCLEGAISIEVWYQNKSKSESIPEEDEYTQTRELSKRWKDVKRHIQFSVAIQELDASGDWESVDVEGHDKIISGGVYRLKQGQSKRIVAQIRLLPRTDGMPFVLHEIRSVEIGSIDTRKIDAPRQLDSYQDEDLLWLRREWLDLIEKRKLDLESQINLLNQQPTKTVYDNHRENVLLQQLMRLTEERNNAVFPPAGSGIPGAPASWKPPPNNEIHRPLIFLNLNPYNMSATNDIAGHQAILNQENKTKMFPLSLIQNASDQIHAVAQWNPSIHDLTAMNQVTPNDTVIYLIVKITVMISQPAPMELVLRKRIAVTMSKSEGWWGGKTIKNFLGYKTYKRTSVVYEIVSSIPKIFHNNEDSNENEIECLSEDDIRKYIQYASTVDSRLLLDKLRQEVLLAENSKKQKTIRKATSVPDITPQKLNTNAFRSPANSRRKDPDKQILLLDESELNSSTPSMASRSMFIEEQQLQPIQTPTLRITHPIDLDDNKPEDNENTLQEKYIITPSSKRRIINEDFSVGSRVIVNTGRSVVQKAGTIRFIGELDHKEGIWYGIELDEAVGKHNGSIDEHIYFTCPKDCGIFVRREKLGPVN